MDVTYYNREATKDGTVSFPSLHCWNHLTKIITIAAQVSGKRILCRVSIKDLKTKYHVFKDEPMKTVLEHRAEIESAARRLIENERFEQDGSIKIDYEDL